jgi:outer membrane protein assembly factor BamB
VRHRYFIPQYNYFISGWSTNERPWAQGSICALNLTDGSKVWENLTRKYQHGSAAYWKGGNLIIWGTADHEMSAFDPKTGKAAWTFATERSAKYAPAISEERGLVAFASFDTTEGLPFRAGLISNQDLTAPLTVAFASADAAVARRRAVTLPRRVWC